MATHITVYTHPVTTDDVTNAATEPNYANLATSVDDVIEKMAELRAAKRARTEADRQVAEIQMRKRSIEQALDTATAEQERCVNEANYLADKLQYACKEWLHRNTCT